MDMHHKNHNNNILKLILAFLILLQFGSVIYSFYPILIDLTCFWLCTIILLSDKKSYNKKLVYSIFIISSLLILIGLFTNNSSLKNNLNIIFRIAVSGMILWIFRINYRIYKNYISRALKVIIYISFINIILINSGVEKQFPSYTAENGYYVRSLFFIFNSSTTAKLKGISFVRNPGIFWEPGILQIAGNLLFYLFFFEKIKSHLIDKIVTIIVILSTFSTTGYIIMSIQILIYLIQNRKNRKYIILYVIFIMPIVLFNLMDKINNRNEYGSFYFRLYDINVGLKIILNNPLLGIGYNFNSYLDSISSFNSIANSQVIRANSNSIIQLYVYFGLVIGSLFLFYLYKQKIFTYKKLVFIIILFSLMSEPLLFTYFIQILFLSGTIDSSHELNKSIHYRYKSEHYKYK